MKDIEKITETSNERKQKKSWLEVIQCTLIVSLPTWCRTRNTLPGQQQTQLKMQPIKNSNDQKNLDIHERHEINQWERMRTRFSVQGDKYGKDIGQYDVVVVLTGLNDLKGLFLPFLQDEAGTNKQSFKEELRKVFMVLSDKMKLQISKMKDSTEAVRRNNHILRRKMGKTKDAACLEYRPLVVIPALPTRPVPMLQYPPLSWFVHLLLELIDEEKRSLSKEFPDDILFVEAPSIEMIAEIEKGQSVLIAKRKAEELLLDLKDITRQVREKIEHLIREHVDIHETSEHDSEAELHYEASHHNNLTNRMPDHVGSKLISFDRVHPNDDGYDFWGRHIAEGIINAWKCNSAGCA